MSHIKIPLFDEDSFKEIEHYYGLAIVRFSAEWCAPCRDSEHYFDAAAAQLKNSVKLGKVNTLQAPVLTAKYGIYSVPNILIFKHGQEVLRLRGPQSTSMLLDAIAPFISDDHIL